MNESAGKSRKRHVDHPKDRYILIYLIHGTGHSSDECKVLRDFGSNFSKIRTNKDRGKDPTIKKKFIR